MITLSRRRFLCALPAPLIVRATSIMPVSVLGDRARDYMAYAFQEFIHHIDRQAVEFAAAAIKEVTLSGQATFLMEGHAYRIVSLQ